MISSILDVLKDKIPIGLFYKINKADNPSKELIKYLTIEEIKEINTLLKKKNINFAFSLDEKIETNTTKTPTQGKCIVHTIKVNPKISDNKTQTIQQSNINDNTKEVNKKDMNNIENTFNNELNDLGQ